jgi:hypothetical protein
VRVQRISRSFGDLERVSLACIAEIPAHMLSFGAQHRGFSEGALEHTMAML